MQILIFVKIYPAGDELFHADTQTGGGTNMTKLTVASRNFSNATKKCAHIYIYIYIYIYMRDICLHLRGRCMMADIASNKSMHLRTCLQPS